MATGMHGSEPAEDIVVDALRSNRYHMPPSQGDWRDACAVRSATAIKLMQRHGLDVAFIVAVTSGVHVTVPNTFMHSDGTSLRFELGIFSSNWGNSLLIFAIVKSSVSLRIDGNSFMFMSAYNL